MADFDPFESGAVALEEPKSARAFDPFAVGALPADAPKEAGYWTGFGAELGERTGQFAKGVAQIVPSTLKTLSVLGQMTAGGSPDDVPVMESARELNAKALKAYREAPPEDQPLYKFGTGIEGGVNQAIPEPTVPDLWHNVARGAGQMAPMLAGGAAAKVAGAGIRGAAALATGMGAVQEFDDAFGRARERGDDADTAFAKSLGYASVAALIENKLGVGRLLRQYFPEPGAALAKITALGVTKKLLGNFVAGGLEEGSQRFAQNWIVDEKPSLEGVMDEALPGAIVQGIAGLPSAATGVGDRKRRLTEIQDYRKRRLVFNEERREIDRINDGLASTAASAARDEVANAVADRLTDPRPIAGIAARLAGARDRLEGMGYAYNEERDEFVPARKVDLPLNAPVLPGNSKTKVTLAAEQNHTFPAGDQNAPLPAATLESVASQPAAQFFDTAAEWARATMASEAGALGPQLRAEAAAKSNPDVAAWEKAYQQAAADAARVKDEITKAPETMPARQKEMMGAAQKAQFFSEGLKVIQAEADAKKAAEVPKVNPVPFAPATALPALENRISELHSLLVNSENFAGSEFYDSSFPIPREGGIVAARSSARYRSDPVFAGKVNAAIKDITDTMVTANRQRMSLLGKPSTGSFGVDYSIEKEKARAGYTVNVVRAWHNEAKQKYPNTGSSGNNRLGNVSVREAFQNSLDAVMAALQGRQIARGEIKINTESHDRKGFIVDDNGIGMSDEDIGSKFLSLHSTGKAVEGRFGGFGIAKAVILGPSDSGTWTLHTRDNEFTHELATANEVVRTAPMRQGTRIEVTTSEVIMDEDARRYIETTDLPKNVAVDFDGASLTNPFKGLKPQRSKVTVNSETFYELSYYKNSPPGYDQQYIIRLVDKKTGARLTQSLRNAGYDGFHGTIIVDIHTTAIPGTDAYPLVDSRMEMKWNAERPVKQLIEKHTIDPLSGARDKSARRVNVYDRQEWRDTLRKSVTDAGYQSMEAVIRKVWDETGQFFGTSPSKPFTPLIDLTIKIDTGYKGHTGGSLFQAKHLAAYEAVSRLMAFHAGAQMTDFYGLLSKPQDGGTVNAEHAAGGVMGLNFLSIDKTSLKSPYTYALYLRDLIAHELTHDFFGPHNENFTSKEIQIQRQTAHLFPQILRIAEATLGQPSGIQVVEKEVKVNVPYRVEVPGPERVQEVRVEVPVPFETFVDRFLTPEQRQFIYENDEQSPTGAAKDDLYHPVGPADAGQFWLGGRSPSERVAGLGGPTEDSGVGRGTQQPRASGVSGSEQGGLGAGGSNAQEIEIAPPEERLVDMAVVAVPANQIALRPETMQYKQSDSVTGETQSHLLTITPQIRESLMAGQPMFSLTQEPVGDEGNYERGTNEELDGAVAEFARSLVAQYNLGSDARAQLSGMRRVEPRGRHLSYPNAPRMVGLEEAAWRAIGRAFSQRIILFEIAKGPLSPDGAVVDTIPNTIFLNVNSNRPLSSLTGHELLHVIRNQQKSLYDEMVVKLGPLIPNLEEVLRQKMEDYQKSGTPILEAKAMEEIVSDLFNDSFGDAAFWERLAAKEPSLFRRLAEAVLKYLNALAIKLKGEGVYQYFSDVAKAHDVIADALVKFRQRTGDEAATGGVSLALETDDETKKQRTFGADIGEDQDIENIETIQAALVENGYGIGDTVTPQNTQAAWEQFASFVDPSKRADTVAALQAAVPQEMAPGIVHSTLWQYAVRLAAAGDPALFRAMAANSNQFQLWNGPAFRSTFGRGLRALRLGADFTTWKNELARTRAQREAIAKELGINPNDISLIDLLVVNLNGATPDADELAKAAAKIIGNQAKERDLTADELYALMSKLIFPVGTTGIEIKSSPKVLQKISAMFPTAGIREMIEKQGASGLARDLWQLLAGPQKPAGPLWTAQAAIRGQLGQILKEAMKRAGIEQANRPPAITSEEKLAKFLGDKETRQNIVARVDEEVRAELEQRQAEEIEAAGENEDLIESIEEKYAQLEDAWRDATSSMLVDTASEALLGRLVRAKLKTLKPEWNLIFGGYRKLADVRGAVIEGITEDVLRVANEGRNPDWLSDAQVGFGEMFDRVAALEKNRYEMNLLAKRAQEQLRLTGKPEQQADALLSQFAREQSDTPSDQKAFAKNEVREAFNGYLSGDITADEFRATLRTINISGAKIESLLGVADRELASRKLIAQLREQERLERAKAREIEKLKGQANATASAILKRLQQDYAGVDWLKAGTTNAIQQILREHYKGSEPILPILGNTNRVIGALAKRFTAEAEVSEDIAQQLANAAEVKRQSDWTNARNRAIQRAKNSGNLRGLIDRILETPYLAQANPQWVRDTAEAWFMENGLSQEQARGAAALFQTEFNAKLLEAQTKIAERLLAKAPPKNTQEFIAALRAGLLDPDKPWADAYAEKAGWKTPTRTQFQKLAELELRLQDPELGAAARAEVTEQMMGIYLHLKLPPPIMSRIAANFIVTNLTGLRTVTVNIFAPFVRLATEQVLRTAARPQDFFRNLQTFFGAYRGTLRRLQFSLHKDAYTFINNEFEQSTNEVRRVWETAKDDINSGSPPRQAKGVIKLLYGSQQFLMRLLNSVDQASAIAEREVQLVNYASTAFRMVGLGSQDITRLVKAVSLIKRQAFEDAVNQGMTEDRAQVHSDEVAIEQIEDFVQRELGDTLEAATAVRKAADAAEKDAYSAIGRLAPGIIEEDEGGIASRMIYHRLLELASRLRGGKGADPILGVSLLGYVSIPFRTARFIAWNTPYGLLRLGIHHYRKRNPQNENQWKQSLANEYQERHRLNMALAGTGALALITGLGLGLMGKSSDDDAGDDELALYVTGRGPKNRNLRDAWQKSGFRESSLVFFINRKPVAIPLTRIGEPMAHFFWLLAARDDQGWRKREKEATGKPFDEGATETTGRALGTYLGLLGQRGMLQNISQWAKIGSGEGGTEKALADVSSRLVASAVVPWLGMQRSVMGMAEGPIDRSSIQSAVAANFGVPGLYFHKQALNRFGDPVGNQTWYGKVADTGIPVAFQVEPTSENQRFYRALVQKGVAAPELRRYVIEERYGQLTDDQFTDFAKRSGALLKTATTRSLSTLERMTPENAKKLLSTLTTQADQTAAASLGFERTKPVSSRPAAISGGSAPARVAAPPRTRRTRLGRRGGLSGRLRISSGRRLSMGGRTRRLSLGSRRLRSPRIRMAAYRAPRQRRLRLA